MFRIVSATAEKSFNFAIDRCNKPNINEVEKGTSY